MELSTEVQGKNKHHRVLSVPAFEAVVALPDECLLCLKVGVKGSCLGLRALQSSPARSLAIPWPFQCASFMSAGIALRAEAL